ncbi:hypothetical protein JCM8097_000700 [Rhodosporidiobolus ruineniae]
MTSLLTPPSSSPEFSGYASATDEAAAFVSATTSALPSYSRRPSDFGLPVAKRPRSSLAHRSSFTANQPVPSAPAPQAHCPTPSLTPEDAEGVEVEQPAPAATFVRRDDLTAKAIAAAQMQQQAASAANQAASQASVANDKDRFVNGLVGASVLAIESIWGSSTSGPASQCTVGASSANGVLPLHWFVKEVLRRSRTSCSTLQLALYYLHKARREIRNTVADADKSRGEMKRLEAELKAVKHAAAAVGTSPRHSYPSPPGSPSDSHDEHEGEVDHAVPAAVAAVSELGARFSALLDLQTSPVLCGRRMFLASLISASKYLQDRNYSNRAWAKISGLSVQEINKNERAFLRLTGFQLHLKAEDFQRWTDRLSTLTAPTSSPSTSLPSPSTSPTLAPTLSTLGRHGLARSASEYVAAPPGSFSSVGPVRSAPVSAVQRAALTRGASLPAVLPLGGAGGARHTGFPIAVAQPRTVSPSALSASSTETELEGESEASDSDVPLAPLAQARKVRALPVRRAVAMDVDGAGFVPASWAAGGRVVGGGVGAGRAEGVRAH